MPYGSISTLFLYHLAWRLALSCAYLLREQLGLHFIQYHFIWVEAKHASQAGLEDSRQNHKQMCCKGHSWKMDLLALSNPPSAGFACVVLLPISMYLSLFAHMLLCVHILACTWVLFLPCHVGFRGVYSILSLGTILACPVIYGRWDYLEHGSQLPFKARWEGCKLNTRERSIFAGFYAGFFLWF